MKKRPHESDLEKWLIRNNNLSQIEKGLVLIGGQVDLGDFGRLDILAKDSKGHYVIVELKGPYENVDETIVSQVFKYRAGLTQKKKYRIGNPSEVRILCFINKIESRARKICEQAGIGIATYDLKEISFPQETIGTLPQTEPKHGVFPVRPAFFRRMDRFSFYDLKQPVKWIKPGSIIVFYSEKKLKAECKVLHIERGITTTKKLNEFLHKIGYLSTPSSTLLQTLIIHNGLKHYDPPVWWSNYLLKFIPHKIFYPQIPMAIDEFELMWIRGQ